MDSEQILANLVRIGTVTAIDAGARKARVKFWDSGNTSGWLSILQHFAAGVYITPDGTHTHIIKDTATGGGEADTQPNHDHTPSYLTYWMPKVNDTVLMLYLPVFNGDGFILGGI